MTYYPADLASAFDHLSQMLDSAVSQDIPRIMGRLKELEIKLSLRLTAIPMQPSVAGAGLENERYLTVHEVVARYGVTAKWLYRHKSKLPHSQPTRKTLLFPEKRFSNWWANQKRHD
jgi:hypothetical protein